jgi:hypothetical protein
MGEQAGNPNGLSSRFERAMFVQAIGVLGGVAVAVMPLFLQIVPVRDDVRDGSNVHAARRKQRPYENAFS